VAAPEGPNLRREGRALFTRNARPGSGVYGEKRRFFDGAEFREWDPWRSKLAGYLLRGGAPPEFERCRSILYLGAAHGTTVSHLADLAPAATVFAVEKSPSAFAPLLALARDRPSVLPILADAQLPERYCADVGVVDLLYQDIAQRDQTRIFLENAAACLRPGGEGILMLKVRSITQRLPAGQIVQAARRELGASGLRTRAPVDLAPFAREHVALRIDS
jgi:fibrillarin-like pre-rRNA processing protein